MITLFEKGNEDYYVSLKMDYEGDDSQITSYYAQSLTLIETMLSSSTYMNVKFVDGTGELIHTRTIIPDTEFEVSYGTDQESITTSSFKLSKLSLDQMNQADMDSIFVKSDMIHPKWEWLFKKNESRSWGDQPYSFVVEEIIKEMGITEYDIETTDGTFDIIQPNWTNNQMLKWLAGNAINKEGIGGYVFYFKLDGSFVFKSLHTLYKQKPSFEYNFSGATQDKNGFNFLGIDNSYMPTLNDGGFGVKYEYFDYDTKTYHQEEKTITDIAERQLSDWYYIPESHNEPTKLVHGGRDTCTEDVSQNIIMNSASAVQKATIDIMGDIEVSVGNVINILIPVTNRIVNNNPKINEVYSGYWLVWKVAHMFDFSQNIFQTKLYISRNGVNGKTTTGLIKTSKGKDIT